MALFLLWFLCRVTAVWMMVWAIDWMSPDLGVTTIATSTGLLRYTKRNDMSSVLCSIEAFRTHDTAVIHRAIPELQMSDVCRVGEGTPYHSLAAKATFSFLEYVLTRSRAIVGGEVDG
jgi:hypothetical protein